MRIIKGVRIMWFKLINNPLTKMVAGKVVDHFKHRAEKVKTIRQAEIEACKEVDISELNHKIKAGKMRYFYLVNRNVKYRLV